MAPSRDSRVEAWRARVSPYPDARIERTLGNGSFGRVVLARYPRGDGPERSVDVAMKVSRNGAGSTRRDILWEAACLRKVAHPHVIKLLDVCASTPGAEEDPSDLPTLMFPPANADLASFLDRFHYTDYGPEARGVLPTALARRLMGQLASALAHVHSHGIIHRDVKPQNCLLFLAAEVHEELLGPALMLADFGAARTHASGDPRRRLDAPAVQRPQLMTARVCTAWYRPPELWAGTMDDHDVDADHDETTLYDSSLDVWSFGAVVYETLAGETLAHRATSGAKMAQAVADVIGACPMEGPGAPEYTQDQRWRSLAAAAPKLGMERLLPDSGPHWDLVRRCVQWHPAARATMDSAKQCAWFVERGAAPEAAPTSQSETPGACADASTLSAPPACADAASLRARAHAWLQTEPSPPQLRQTPSGTCACKGHCQKARHRREGKCDCTELVVGTKYCIECKCIVGGCARPRNKSDFCYHHKTVVEGADFRVQLAVAAVPLAPLLMPCDVVDFLSQSTLLRDDLAMLILTAAIKEPLPVGALVEAWKQLPSRAYSGSDLRSAILRAVAAADGATHGAQLDQLHRQGVCRFFGLITTAANLGIIAKKAERPVPRRRAQPVSEATAAGASAKQEYRLGRNQTVYVVLDVGSSKCDQFLEATRAEEPFLATSAPSDAGASTPCDLDDLVDYGTRRAEQALRRIGAKSGALPFSAKDASGYCIDFLLRKLVMARLLLQQNMHEFDWSTVSKASLQAMSADAKENLAQVPDAWKASEISFFFTGRADWALLASVYPCLWGEVADKLSTNDERDRAVRLVKSQEFLRVVQNFRVTEGIAPHPAVAYKIMNDKEKPPRASTPRSKEIHI